MIMTRLACLIVVAVLFCVPAHAQDTDAARKAEAERFAAESLFLHGQKRYAEALEAAETAFALNPELKAHQERLIEALLYMSLESFAPGNMNHAVQRDGSGEKGHPKVPAEKIRHSLEYASRAAEIQDKYALYLVGESYLSAIYVRAQSYLSTIRAFWEKHAPEELKPELAAFNHQMLEQWIEKMYKPALERFNNGTESRDASSFKRILFDTVFHVAQNHTDKNTIALFEMLTNDLFPAHSEWYTQNIAGDTFSCVLLDLAIFASLYRDVPMGERNPEVGTALERILAVLDNDPQLAVRIHAWLVRNKVRRYYHWQLDIQNRGVTETYFQWLKEHAKNLPPDISPKEYSILYEEARALFFGSEEKQRGAEILEIANTRNEFSSTLANWCLGVIADGGNALADNERARFTALFAKQIELGLLASEGSSDLSNAKAFAERAAVAGIPLQGAPERVRPWQEEVVLFERKVRHDKRPGMAFNLYDQHYFHPFFRDDTIYFFVSDVLPQSPPVSPSMRLASIDLKTLERKEHPEQRHVHWSASDDVTYVDDTNAYYGTGHQGVLVFPLDGSEPWSIGPQDDLPGKKVHGLASMNGKLYVGLADTQQRSWLIAVDLETRNWKTIISSSAAEGTTPLADISPGPAFRAFFADVKHNRLLFFVDRLYGNDQRLCGLWTLDGKTHEIVWTRLPEYTALPGHIPVSEDRMLLSDRFGVAMLLDLEKAHDRFARQFLCHAPAPGRGDAAVREYRLLQGTLLNGYLWGNLSEPSNSFTTSNTFISTGKDVWARIAADGGSEPEWLAFPESVKTQNWTPSVICRATSDGKNLIVGDGYSLILLRFE